MPEVRSQIPIIEEVLHVTDPRDVVGSLTVATAVLTGGPVDWAQDAVITKTWYDRLSSQTDRERWFDLHILNPLLTNDGYESTTTLMDWQVYDRLMRAYGTRANGNATALLIGSHSAISSRSFVCLAEDVYGANRKFVVDPVAGADKVRHGNFVFGSGTQLPFGDETMDFVHTNQLLHALKDPSKDPSRRSSARQDRARLFQEIGRVTAPGGQVFMKELIDNYVPNLESEKARAEALKLGTYVVNAFKKRGFEAVHVDAVMSPQSQEKEFAYLFDPERHIGEPQFASYSGIEVYARKLAPRLFRG